MKKKSYYWTDEEQLELVKLCHQGMDYKTIAERIGRTEKAVRKKAALIGISCKTPRKSPKTTELFVRDLERYLMNYTRIIGIGHTVIEGINEIAADNNPERLYIAAKTYYYSRIDLYENLGLKMPEEERDIWRRFISDLRKEAEVRNG